MTGQKVGLSDTLGGQMRKIFERTANALRAVALQGYKPKEDGRWDQYLETHPDQRPTLVIDNFMYKAGENEAIYEAITSWLAVLVEANIAHVIILTSDASYQKRLSKRKSLRKECC